MVDTQATDLQEELTLLMTMVLESDECRNEVNSGCTDATNASYEEIEEKESLKHVDFYVGKNMQISVHCSHNHFCHEQVHQYVLDSPIDS